MTEDKGHGEKPETHVQVVVVTTSGKYPSEGSDRVSAHQPLGNQLKQAVRELKIVDTTDWVATVGGNPVDAEQSYLDNGLSGSVSVDYGRNHGGGGR